MSVTIHPTAIIASSAQIGIDVTIGPYVIIEDDVNVGDRTYIDSHAVIKQYTRIGTDNHIHSHAMVGGQPQDLKFSGEITWLEIGNYNKIREFATLHRGTAGGGGITKIGNNNLFMAYTHVAHDCILGSNIVMSNCSTLAGHVHIDNFAILGGLSAVHQFCKIGEHAFIGGMTGISEDIPPWMLITGRKGIIHAPNLVGLRRANVPSTTIAAVKDTFKLIWKSTIPRPESLKTLEKKYPDVPEVQSIIRFIRNSERGVCNTASGSEPSDELDLL